MSIGSIFITVNLEAWFLAVSGALLLVCATFGVFSALDIYMGWDRSLGVYTLRWRKQELIEPMVILLGRLIEVTAIVSMGYLLLSRSLVPMANVVAREMGWWKIPAGLFSMAMLTIVLAIFYLLLEVVLRWAKYPAIALMVVVDALIVAIFKVVRWVDGDWPARANMAHDMRVRRRNDEIDEFASDLDDDTEVCPVYRPTTDDADYGVEMILLMESLNDLVAE